MRSPGSVLVGLCVGALALGLAPVVATATASAAKTTTTTTAPLALTTTSYEPDAPYTPTAQSGGTDDYHCKVIDPHVTQAQYITASQLVPDQTRTAGQSNEVHHAIYFLISGTSNIAQANQLNAGSGGHGWTCFDAPLNPSGSFDGTTWLGGWAPGRGVSTSPGGTGIPLPANSLIVLQMHYNLLKGDHPDLLSASPDHGTAGNFGPPAALARRQPSGAAGHPVCQRDRPGGAPALREQRRTRGHWCAIRSVGGQLRQPHRGRVSLL